MDDERLPFPELFLSPNPSIVVPPKIEILYSLKHIT
jgi:hypothetical protein